MFLIYFCGALSFKNYSMKFIDNLFWKVILYSVLPTNAINIFLILTTWWRPIATFRCLGSEKKGKSLSQNIFGPVQNCLQSFWHGTNSQILEVSIRRWEHRDLKVTDMVSNNSQVGCGEYTKTNWHKGAPHSHLSPPLYHHLQSRPEALS